MDRAEHRAHAQKSDQESNQTSSGSGIATATGLYEAGLQHMQAGRHLEAQLCCRQALAADPDHVDTLHLMGLLSLQAKQYDHAIAWIARANRLDPATDYLFSLGTALEQQGLRQEAFNAFDRAVQLRRDDAELWAAHGNALAQLGRLTEALSSYQRVLVLDPRQADAAFRCGLLWLTLKKPEGALACFNLCNELNPNHAAVLEQRALALHDLKRFDEALADNLRAHALNPANAQVCNNIGAGLQRLRRDAEALPWFDKAIALQPRFIVALNNKASSLTQIRRIAEAITVYEQVRMIDPGNADADWNLSLLDLLIGNYQAGWAGREVRWKAHMRPAAYPHFPQPMWLGKESIEGRTILVYADEGIGDTLQFARYVPMLAARGARVILAVQDPLQPWLAKLSGVVQCVPRSAALPPFDMHCPVCTLPYAFRTRLNTIPAPASYLPPAPAARVEAWEWQLRQRLGAERKLRVGLVWSGNPQQMNDHNRSVPLRLLLPLLDVDANFISLQKDPRPDDQAVLARSGIVDFAADLTDFVETAALAGCVDLVISVCTSIAHMAGGLGRPTWVLLSYAPDWRWLLDRDDSPWYPTARLFRQNATRDWAELIGRVRRELAEYRA
ncbi:MAG TPA: tetratricopeptide repeat-containing glycosyltransferase family protein [Bradyrhizobium sp.]|uniref:tetratricopeptide repeat-containing glycosyltransferase family protein n=1 Tax=Bradyrhizobium sp. TaxID=376 RepID=UPI002BF74A38|nr:tetratricopeptide repeat-containing glycosyltransferase family protein [Bradyrhizobium sp.]HLZ00710.1 tetratricopeptide repeat-containing glycosyltransferase family protein [Bradyrhizobium sp.]